MSGGIQHERRHATQIVSVVVLGMLASASIGDLREPLDLPGASAATLRPETSREPAPTDRAQVGAGTDLAPAALFRDEMGPPAAERRALSLLTLSRCPAGYQSSLEHPPRAV